MRYVDVLEAMTALPAVAVRELAKGPISESDNSGGCRVCEALRGTETPLRDWHSGSVLIDGRPRTSPALASARCMVIYAIAAYFDALKNTEPDADEALLALNYGSPDFDLENGEGKNPVFL